MARLGLRFQSLAELLAVSWGKGRLNVNANQVKAQSHYPWKSGTAGHHPQSQESENCLLVGLKILD